MTVNQQDPPTQYFQRASSDEDSKSDFDSKIQNSSQIKGKKSTLIIDRTNLKQEDRMKLLDLAYNPKNTICIIFDISIDVIVDRLINRTSHPTFNS